LEDLQNAIEAFYSQEAFSLEDIQKQHIAKLYANVLEYNIPCAGNTKQHYIEAIRKHFDEEEKEEEENVEIHKASLKELKDHAKENNIKFKSNITKAELKKLFLKR